MWVTIVREVFRDQDRVAVRDAIEEIASPLDGYGWSSAGIYAFWDPETREILYLGLATDLPYRFGQHTGLVKCRPTSCKIVQINQWFEEHPELGYTLLLQTSNVQPLGHRLAKDLGLGLDEAKLDPLTETDPLPGELEDFEGRLIEYHRLQKGSRPRWNNIGGSVAGAAQVQGLTPDDLFEVITGPADSFFVSRRTLRQLAADPTSTAFEEHLHTARIRTIMFGQPGSSIGPHDLLEQVHALGDGANEEGSRIRDQGYLAEPAPFSE